MHVLVTGGTGFIGSHLCPALAERGHDVTALARDPDDASFDDADVTTVAGDVTEFSSIVDHVESADAVVNLVALSPLYKPRGGDERHFDVHLRGTENLVEAAEAYDVDRFVQQSALGADPDGPTHYIRAKGEAEDVVTDSSLDWVVFQPSIIFGDGGEFVTFTRTLATPYLTPLPGGGTNQFQPIRVGEFVEMAADAVEGTVTGPRASGDEEAADADVEAARADAATDDAGEQGAADREASGDEASGDEAADDGVDAGTGDDAAGGSAAQSTDADGNDPHVGNVYQIGGPEVLTLAEVAELAWAAEGKPVSVVPIPMALARLGLSALDVVPGAPFGRDQYNALGIDNTVARNDVEAFGWAPADLTTLREYLGIDGAALAR
jgi:NADH dehydrogenase